MTDLNLKTFNKLYPMMIKKYSDLIVDQNASEKDKINSIILKLNALGKLSNDVVRDWNTVYQWAMNDGLTQDVNNKLEDMLAKGQLKSITDALVAEIGDLTTLTTPQKDTVVHSINSLQSEVTTNTNAIATNTANIASNTSQLADIAYNVKRFGAKGDGVQDDTNAIQSAFNAAGIGGKIYFPPGFYKVAGTLTRLAGQTIEGAGWVTVTGSYSLQAGSVIKQVDTSNIPLFQTIGLSDSDQRERGGFRDIALLNASGVTTVGTGIKTNNARQLQLQNVYVSSFNTGIEQSLNSWQWTMQNVRIFDAQTCLLADNEGEDSTYIGCVFRPYRPSSYGVHLKNMSQTNLFLGCDISNADTGVWLDQGDNAGNGTGQPYPMHASFINCQMEDPTTQAFLLTSSNPNYDNRYHPMLSVIGCRSYGFTNPNTGQTFIKANQASQIKVENLISTGLSYGINIGTKVGAVKWVDNNASIFGGGIAAGTKDKLSLGSGDHPICILNSTALSYVTPNYTTIPFATVVSDYWGWSGGNNITPKRNQTVRFKIKVAIDSAPIGSYFVLLKKNEANFKQGVAYQSTANQPLTIETEIFDTPNGLSDYYTAVLYSSSSCSINTTDSYFSSEVCGS